jgi:hypothetical protein
VECFRIRAGLFERYAQIPEARSLTSAGRTKLRQELIAGWVDLRAFFAATHPVPDQFTKLAQPP